MENDAGAVRIKALFSNIIVKGASNYTVKEVRSDVSVSRPKKMFFFLTKLCLLNNDHHLFQKLRIDMRINIPRVESRGKYDISGQVLLLPVRSNGDFWAEFSK